MGLVTVGAVLVMARTMSGRARGYENAGRDYRVPRYAYCLYTYSLPSYGVHSLATYKRGRRWDYRVSFVCVNAYVQACMLACSHARTHTQ